MNPTLSAALNYASQGVKVLPLHYIRENGICSCGGKERNPQCKAGKHPYGNLVPNGLKDATSDPTILKKWFADGRLNLGVVTGSDSGFFVIDQDDLDGGDISIHELEKKHGPLPKTLVQRTGNGQHYLFRMPAGIDVSNSQKLLGTGIDVRGSGGYICAAPSKHVCGRHYEWIDTDTFESSLIAEAPSWLIRLATANQNKKPALVVDNNDLIHTTLFSVPPHIKDGEGRESFILSYAGHLRAKGRSQVEIEQELLKYNLERITPPLHEEIVLDRARRFAHISSLTSESTELQDSIEDRPGDIENGRLFAARFRGQFMYVFSAKKWLHWDERRWIWCESGEDLSAAKQVADILLDRSTNAIKQAPNDPNVKRMLTHAINTRDERRLRSMLALAQSESGMGIGQIGELDTNPWLLNVQNGVVELKTGALLAHDPRMLQTKICSANYLPGADCPQWKKFLKEIFCDDDEMIAFIQRALGYSLTGLVSEEVLFFMFGYGANGKSVFINIIAMILADYAMTAPASMLALRRNEDKGRPSPEVARLVGARFAVANETQSNDRLDEQLVKVLVSRERIAARELYAGYFEFVPTHTLWIRGNHKPIVTGDDHGIWRRIQLIPFARTFKPEEVDHFLEDKLAAEKDGILTWMIEGCLKWQKEKLNPPETVRNASAQYRKESDVLGQWLEEECDSGVSLKCLQRAVYGAYGSWCNKNGLRPMTKTMFTRKLHERGCIEGWINRERAYVGICLRSPLTLSSAA